MYWFYGDSNLNFLAVTNSCMYLLWLWCLCCFFPSHNPFRLVGVGLLIWTIAAAGCGCSFDFWSITICRMWVSYLIVHELLEFVINYKASNVINNAMHSAFRLVGVGEASFISLAAPFIDDNAPVAQVCFLFCWGTSQYAVCLRNCCYYWSVCVCFTSIQGILVILPIANVLLHDEFAHNTIATWVLTLLT